MAIAHNSALTTFNICSNYDLLAISTTDGSRGTFDERNFSFLHHANGSTSGMPIASPKE